MCSVIRQENHPYLICRSRNPNCKTDVHICMKTSVYCMVTADLRVGYHPLRLCSHTMFIHIPYILHLSDLLFQQSLNGMAVGEAVQGTPVGTTSPSLTLTNVHTVAATLPSCGGRSILLSSCTRC